MLDVSSVKDVNDFTIRHNVLWNAQIEILTLCNFNCKHCYIPDRISKGLSYEKLSELADAFFDLGVFNVTLTGGEIFTREDIIEVVELFTSKGFRVSLYSNGSILSENIVRKLKDLGIVLFSTTIFSLDSSINDEITQVKGSLERILKNVDLLKANNIPVQIKMPIMKQNYTSYEALKHYCDERKISFFPSPNITPKTNGDKSPLLFELEDDMFARIIRDIYQENKKRNVEIENSYDANEVVCKALNNSVFINSNGNVFPCISWPIKIGNIYEESLESIWNGSTELYKLRKIKKSDMKLCGKCKYSTTCTICPGDSMEDGDMLGCSSLQKKCAKSILGLL
jgi:radical SAM protein with 4Fe4S-binding SPASM domain